MRSAQPSRPRTLLIGGLLACIVVIALLAWRDGDETGTSATAPGRPWAPPASTCTGVEIRPGASIQAAMDANPSGTVFCIRAGTYRLTSSIVPKSDVQLLGEAGTVLTGGDEASVGIRGWGTGATGVVVRGLVVERFVRDGIQASDGWVVEFNELRYNRQSGLKPGAVTRNNYIHHNGRYGISGGYGSVDSLVEGNEIAFNNTGGHDWLDAGATKFITTRGLKVLRNDVHDNDGPGLWTDGNNAGTLIEGNDVHDNAGTGIIHEISYDAVIRRNSVVNNGHDDSYRLGGAGIQISSSRDTEVAENEVLDNRQGIVVAQQGDRGSGPLGAYEARDNRIHDNRVRMREGFSGAHAYDLDNRTEKAFFTSWGNRFDANTYHVPDPARRWWRWSGKRTWLDWRDLGFDLSGSALEL